MLFADCIQKLHSIVEPQASRANFTEKILKLLVTNEKILNYSDSSYKGFYDGVTEGTGKEKRVVGDKIYSCARIIEKCLDESKAKFSNYISSLQFNTTAKNKLCDSFRDEIPDINPDNYPEKLGQLLIKIIVDAAGNGENSNNKVLDPSKTETGNKTDRMTINRKAIERVKAILEDISILYSKLDRIAYRRYERLMNDEKSYLVPLGELQPDEEDNNNPEQMKLREEFDTKHTQLVLYQESIPEVKRDVEEIVVISKCLRFRYASYYISNNVPSITVGSEYVSARGEHEDSGYIARLQELMRKLTEMENAF